MALGEQQREFYTGRLNSCPSLTLIPCVTQFISLISDSEVLDKCGIPSPTIGLLSNEIVSNYHIE